MWNPLTALKSTTLWHTAATVALAVALIGSIKSCADARADQKQVANCVGITLVVNDSTQAQCSKLQASRNELLALKDAATKMNGTLIAGTTVVIKRDTLVKHDTTVVTKTLVDGTRVAALNDTTADYLVHIDATAPPTGDLKVGYTIITPERNIEVGFVKRADGYYAVASGKGIKTKESFFTPEHERPLSLVVGGAVLGSPSESLIGAKLRADVYGALQYEKGSTNFQVRLGHDGSPYVGLAAQCKIW